jgi:long-chain acyl-CoA synthetase
MPYQNIHSLFSERLSQYSDKNIFYVRQNNEWLGLSWNNFAYEVNCFSSALLSFGLNNKRSVCILMGTVPEWPISDLGTIFAGGVSVGLYPTSSTEQCKYIINHSDAEFIVVDTKNQLEKILQIRSEIPNIKKIIVLDEKSLSENETIISYKNFLEFGKKNQNFVKDLLQERANAQTEDIAIMVYTSGTTGLPKGACLSHRYIINSVESLLKTIPVYDTDRSFSYLPYCHVAERITGFYNRLYAASPAYFVDDLNKLWEYMQEVKPSIFGSLPRFFEKIHSRIIADVEKMSPDKRDLFYKVLKLGQEIDKLKQNKNSVPTHLTEIYENLSNEVRKIIKGYFGGEIRIASSGGAPLPQEIAEFFSALGLPILQAYGLTENVCTAFNRADNHRFGTVGQPMPGCEIKLAEDKEILLRSEMMFSGYYKEPEKSAEMFSDGWLVTGDLGEITPEGFLKIIGRKKELIITSTGKNIAPALLENLLKEHHLISQAMAYGDGKSYLTALITLNQIETQEYAIRNNINFSTFAELTQKKEIFLLVQSLVEKVNSQVSSTEAIKKFLILPHDLSVEADEITPTMKVKRNIVTKNYKDLLEGLYI